MTFAINRTTLDVDRRLAEQGRQMRAYGYDLDQQRLREFFLAWLDGHAPRCIEERYCHSAFEEWPLSSA